MTHVRLQWVIFAFFFGFLVGGLFVYLSENKLLVKADSAGLSSSVPFSTASWSTEDFASFRQLVITDGLSTTAAAEQVEAGRLLRTGQ